MGVYERKDSPYFWIWIEGTKSRMSTGIRSDAPGHQRGDNRRLAEQMYHEHVALDAKRRLLAEAPQDHYFGSPDVPIRKALDGWCYVYAIQAGDRIKIGRAVDVQKRLKSLQTGNATALTLLAAIPAHAMIERLIHERFRHLRINGEWFRPDESLLKFIGLIRDGHNPVALLWDEEG